MIRGTVSRSKGFATITLMLFLPLVCLLVFSFGFVTFVIQHKARIRSTCLLQARDIQKTLIQYEENLFRMNPIARSLRLRLRLAQIQLVAAQAAQNWPLVAKVQIEIVQIKTSQKNLDLMQKTLIQAGNLQVKGESLALQNQLTGLGQDINQVWSYYLRSQTTVNLIHFPELAVVRDSADMAPVYELHSEHTDRQKLAFKWQTSFSTDSAAQKFIESENTFKLYCSVTAKNERNKWKLLIDVDKY